MKQLAGQISMFDNPEINTKQDRLHEMYQAALEQRSPHEGKSWFERGQKEIRELVIKADGDLEQLADLLKDYYGTGGGTIKNGFWDYDPIGFFFRAYKPYECMIVKWKKVAKDIHRLVATGLW